jgi:hypothetical protein
VQVLVFFAKNDKFKSVRGLDLKIFDIFDTKTKKLSANTMQETQFEK